MYQKIKNIPLLVRGKGRWAAFAVLALSIGILSNALLFSNDASAATLGLSDRTDKSIQKLLLHRGLGYCIKDAALSGGSWFQVNKRINNNADANAGRWFGETTSIYQEPTGPTLGTYMSDSRLGLNAGDLKNPYTLPCSDEKWIAMAIAAIEGGGADAGVDMLCKMGLVRADGSSTNFNTCKAGNGDFRYPDDTNKGGDSMYQKFIAQYPEPSLDDEGWYWFYRKTFNWSCGYGKMTTPVTRADIENNQYGYGLKYVTDSEPWFTTTYIVGHLKRTDTIYTRLVAGGGGGTVNRTCAEIEAHIKEYADKFIGTVSSMSESEREALLAEAPADETSGGTGEITKCVVEGIGWIVCPLMNAIGGVSDAMYGWIATILELNPLVMEDESGEETPQYVAWQRIRDIANVLLVIVFLIVIFSQLTSIGVSNYGVKKLLPRIIMVAILINVSFIAMMLAIDLVNIIGSSLYDILIGLAPDVTGSSLDGNNAIGSFIAGLVGGTLVGTGVTIGLGTIGAPALALLALPFVAVAALALLAAIATLFIRNALVIVLVLVAPVAFAAMLLPNTQPLFDRWRKLLVGVLFLYPTAALLFGGTKFAAYVIANSDQPLTILVAIFVMAAPLGMLPWLATSSGGILGSIGGKLQSMAKSVKSPLQNALKGTVANQKAGYQAGRRSIFGRRRTDEQMATREAAGRRNWGQRLAQSREAQKADTGNAEGEVTEQVKERGLNPGSARDRRYGQIMDQQQTLGERKGANGAEYKLRSDRRKQTPGTVDYANNLRQEDATFESGRIGSELKDAQIERIRNNGALNASEMAKRTAEQSTKRYESQLDAQFKGEVAADQGLTDVVQEQKLAEQESTTLDKEQGAVFETSVKDEQLAYREELAERETKTAGDREKARYEETLSTSMDVDPTDPLAAEIERARIASEESVVSASRTSAAQTMQQQERAERIQDPNSGLAARMGGINPDGANLEVARAIETDRKTYDANVAAYTVRLRDQNLPDGSTSATYAADGVTQTAPIIADAPGSASLVGVATDPRRSAEERDAAGRAIVDGGNIDTIIPYVDYLSTSLSNAQSRMTAADGAIAQLHQTAADTGVPVDPAALQQAEAVRESVATELSTVQSLQKSFADKIGSSPGKPLGIGAAEIAQFRTGSYVRPQPSAKVPAPMDTSSLSTSEMQTLNTVLEKGVSMDNWAAMDKTDIRAIYKMIDQGLITGPRLAEMKTSIQTTLTDPRWSGRVKEREQDLLGKLEARIP